jgi:hypothetical protein
MGAGEELTQANEGFDSLRISSWSLDNRWLEAGLAKKSQSFMVSGGAIS